MENPVPVLPDAHFVRASLGCCSQHCAILVRMTGDYQARYSTGSLRLADEAAAGPAGSPEPRLPQWRNARTGRRSAATDRVHPTAELERLGFRFGARGTQSSRSVMLRELSELLDMLPANASRSDYRTAIVEENVLAKPTQSARLTTGRCLTQLYGLDPDLPLFRVLRRLWEFERSSPHGRQLLGLLTALARDPLLRITAGPVLGLGAGEELVRTEFAASIRRETGPRFNDATLNKIAVNAATSWTQSGHLDGRMRKTRRIVSPTPAAVALALWLGESEGRAGLRLIDSRWAAVLDLPGGAMLEYATQASRLGLIRLRAAGNVVEVSARALDTESLP